MTKKAEATRKTEKNMKGGKKVAKTMTEGGKSATARAITAKRGEVWTGQKPGPRLTRNEAAERGKKTKAAAKKTLRKSEQERSRKEKDTAGRKTKKATTERKPKKQEKCGKGKRKRREKKRRC